MKMYLLILIIILISSCRISNEKINEGWWKYGSGAHIGDVIDFKSCQVKNDTIFRNSIPKGIIIPSVLSYTESLFSGHKRLRIKSIETKEIGIYHQKGI